jgi:hypothetical protein
MILGKGVQVSVFLFSQILQRNHLHEEFTWYLQVDPIFQNLLILLTCREFTRGEN